MPPVRKHQWNATRPQWAINKSRERPRRMGRMELMDGPYLPLCPEPPQTNPIWAFWPHARARRTMSGGNRPVCREQLISRQSDERSCEYGSSEEPAGEDPLRKLVPPAVSINGSTREDQRGVRGGTFAVCRRSARAGRFVCGPSLSPPGRAGANYVPGRL